MQNAILYVKEASYIDFWYFQARKHHGLRDRNFFSRMSVKSKQNKNLEKQNAWEPYFRSKINILETTSFWKLVYAGKFCQAVIKWLRTQVRRKKKMLSRIRACAHTHGLKFSGIRHCGHTYNWPKNARTCVAITILTKNRVLSRIRACAHTHGLQNRFFPGSVIADTLTTGQKKPVLASQLRFWRLFFCVYTNWTKNQPDLAKNNQTWLKINWHVLN